MSEVHTPRGEVVLTSVGKSFGDGVFAKEVVQNCSLTIEKGKLTVLIGPSGCGKSTLINLVAGYDRPSQGTLMIDGKRITGPGVDRLVVFQETSLMPWLTTYRNILSGPEAKGRVDSTTLALADSLLEKVGLTAFRSKYPSQLSGGMQRRAELARAMINDPSLMILDEPFRGLDAMTKVLMLEYFARLFEEGGRTTLFVTTDIDEAVFLADRLIIMSNRPTRVREIIDISLPRPRRLADLVESNEANQIKMRALAILHSEAMKSFSAGSKSAADFVEAYSRRASDASAH